MTEGRMITREGNGILGRQPCHRICTNASRGLSVELLTFWLTQYRSFGTCIFRRELSRGSWFIP